MFTNRDEKDKGYKGHILKSLEIRVMTVNTVVDKKASVAIHTVTGEITFQEIRSSYESVHSHPDFQENMNSIWDIRDADASKFDSQEVIRIARYFETQTKTRAKYKVAVIVSRDLEYGVSRKYQVAAADLPAKIGIFINLDEAKKWVAGSD
ncbi:MAG: hypothetical protein R6U40_04640 [Desulfobacterales bacterium]